MPISLTAGSRMLRLLQTSSSQGKKGAATEGCPFQPIRGSVSQSLGLLDHDTSGVCSVAFIVVEDFTAIALVSALETMRLANAIANKQLFSWSIHSANNSSVVASNGMTVGVDPNLDRALTAQNILLCSGTDADLHVDAEITKFLRQAAGKGRKIGAVCTGTYALAKVGLLDDHICTIHWLWQDALREQFPALTVSRDLFVLDRRRLTCAGGTAVVDMVLSHIAARNGEVLAAQVGNQMMHESIRECADVSSLPFEARVGTSNRRVLEAIRIMESNIETPIPIDGIASRIGITRRQLERLFSSTMQRSPFDYYREARLRRAQYLLRHTDLSITEISLASGFAAPSNFSAAFRSVFGLTPQTFRRSGFIRVR